VISALASRRRSPLWLAGLLALAATPAKAAVRYIAPTGSDTASCTSPTSPCRTLQYAITQSAASGDEIRLAGGTYSGAGACSAIGSSAVACILNKQLTVRGGYSTSDWTTSLPTLNLTIIDGQNLRRGLVVERTSGTAPVASLVLENLEVRNGYGPPRTAGTGDALTFGFGGGIDAANSPLTLRGVTLADCRTVGSAAAGDYAGAASGGGLAARNSPSLPVPTITLESVRFLRNVADAGDNSGSTGRGGYAHGGGFYTYFVNVSGTDLLFQDNQSLAGSALASDGRSASGERGDALGGAISIEFGSTVSLADAVFSGNLARGGDASSSNSQAVAGGAFGGGIQIEGSPLQSSSLHVSDSDIVQNYALGGNAFEGGLARGSGVSMNDAPVTLDRVLLIANDAFGGDGAAGNGGCDAGEGKRGAADGGGATLTRYLGSVIPVTLRNTIVADNRSHMGTTGCEPGGGGGGLALDGVDVTLEHVTLAGNSIGSTSMQGSGLVMLSTVAISTADWSFGIVANHVSPAGASAIHAQTGAVVTFDRGLFAGNADDTNSGAAGSGSFSGFDTTTTAASGGFVSPGSPAYDYRLGAGSAAIGAALGSTQTVDFEGQPRSAPRDLGADELGSPAGIFVDDFETADFRRWS
jgi:hypothetical protein